MSRTSLSSSQLPATEASQGQISKSFRDLAFLSLRRSQIRFMVTANPVSVHSLNEHSADPSKIRNSSK